MQKLLFNYLCDNCDCAGFIEIVISNWANEIGTDKKQIQGALKGLERGLIYSNTNDCIYLRTFLKHQKNLPLNESNQAHKGIIKRFLLYSHKFDIQDINVFLEGALKGLERGYGNGNGIGNDIGNSKKTEEERKIILRERAVKWKEEVFSFGYPKEMLKEFFKYWIEPNKSFTKLKFELEETWDLNLRLQRWASNQDKFKGKKEETTTVYPSKNVGGSNCSISKRSIKEPNLMQIILQKAAE